MEKTLYEILEVSENASQEVIEKAYKVLVKKYHPDLQQDANKENAEIKIKKINDAYDILSDEIKRKEYDEELNKKRQHEKQLEEERIIEEANKVRQNFINTQNETNSIQEENQNSNEPIQTQNTNLKPEQIYWERQKQEFQQEYEKEYARILQQYSDEKIQKRKLKKIERKLENKYLERYDLYLRKLGYKVKFRWTFEKVRALLIFILSIILIGFILWKFPPTHNILVNIYESNGILKSVIDIIISIFTGIITGIVNVFKN